MAKETSQHADFIGWLKSPQGQQVIETAARKIAPKLALKRLWLSGEEGVRIDLESLKAELYLLLAEKSHKFRVLYHQPDSKAMYYLQQSLLNHCLEKARNEDDWRNFRKRARDALHQRGLTYYDKSGNKRLWLCRHPAHREAKEYGEYEHEKIGFPSRVKPSAKEVRKADNLYLLASHFLDCFEKMYGRPVRVDFNIFVNWIWEYVDLHRDRHDLAGGAMPGAGDSDQRLDVDRVRPDTSDTCFDREKIAALVKEIDSILKDREKQVLYYRIQGYTLEKIAALAGYRGPSGAKQAADRIEKKLRAVVEKKYSGLELGDKKRSLLTEKLFLELLEAELKKYV